MVANDAYLVNADDADSFARALASEADAHPQLSVELTGPWPPYSFAAIVEEATP